MEAPEIMRQYAGIFISFKDGMKNTANIKMNSIRKIRIKYHRIPLPMKASFWFMICSLLNKGCSFISTPIFTRLMSTTEYGRYSLYVSWYGLLRLFITLNLSGVAYNNALTKYEEDKNIVTFSFLVLSTIATSIFLLIYFLGFNLWSSFFDISLSVIIMAFISYYSEPSFEFWSVNERYDYKYKSLVFFSVLSTIINLGLGILLVYKSSLKYEARILAGTITSFIFGILFYYIIAKKANFQIKIEYWRYGVKISISLLPHFLSMFVLGQSDKLMIGKLCDNSKVALYSLSYTIAMAMTIVTDAINKSLIPFLYKNLKKGTYCLVRRYTALLLIAILVMSILMMLAAPEILSILATKEYYDAVNIIPPISLSVYYMFLYVLFCNVEYYYEKTSFVTVATIGAAITNIVLNYFLIPVFGYYAAGYTTLFSYMLLSIMHFYQFKSICKQKDGLSSLYDAKIILIVSVVGLIMMLLSLMLYSYKYIRLSLILILGIVLIRKRNQIKGKLFSFKDK